MTEGPEKKVDEEMDKAEIYLDASMQRLKWERAQIAAAKIQMDEWHRKLQRHDEEVRAYDQAELLCVLPAIEGKDVEVTFPSDQRLNGKVVRVTRHHFQLTDGVNDYYIGWDAAPYIMVTNKGESK